MEGNDSVNPSRGTERDVQKVEIEATVQPNQEDTSENNTAVEDETRIPLECQGITDRTTECETELISNNAGAVAGSTNQAGTAMAATNDGESGEATTDTLAKAAKGDATATLDPEASSEVEADVPDFIKYALTVQHDLYESLDKDCSTSKPLETASPNVPSTPIHSTSRNDSVTTIKSTEEHSTAAIQETGSETCNRALGEQTVKGYEQDTKSAAVTDVPAGGIVTESKMASGIPESSDDLAKLQEILQRCSQSEWPWDASEGGNISDTNKDHNSDTVDSQKSLVDEISSPQDAGITSGNAAVQQKAGQSEGDGSHIVIRPDQSEDDASRLMVTAATGHISSEVADTQSIPLESNSREEGIQVQDQNTANNGEKMGPVSKTDSTHEQQLSNTSGELPNTTPKRSEQMKADDKAHTIDSESKGKERKSRALSLMQEPSRSSNRMKKPSEKVLQRRASVPMGKAEKQAKRKEKEFDTSALESNHYDTIVLRMLLNGKHKPLNTERQTDKTASEALSNNETMLESLRKILLSQKITYRCPHWSWNSGSYANCPYNEEYRYSRLVHHMLTVHSCKFGWKLGSTQELVVGHARGKYSCESCAFTSLHPVQFLEHLRHHVESTAPYACDFCQIMLNAYTAAEHLKDCVFFREGGKFTLILQIDTANQVLRHRYACAVCTNHAGMLSHTAYMIHLFDHADFSVVRVEEELRRTAFPYKKVAGMYTCDSCAFDTCIVDAFVEHVRCHLVAAPYSCDTCERSFSSPKEYLQHTYACSNAMMSVDDRFRRQMEKIMRQIESPPKKQQQQQKNSSPRQRKQSAGDKRKSAAKGGEKGIPDDDDVIVVIHDNPLPKVHQTASTMPPPPVTHSSKTKVSKVQKGSTPNPRSLLKMNANSYTCPAHSFVSSVYVTYLRHIAHMHDDFTKINREVQDGSCPITYKDNHYMCQGCRFQTQLRVAFREHMRMHTLTVPYYCAKCGREFTSLDEACMHGCTEAGICVRPSSDMEMIMSKLGPLAPAVTHEVIDKETSDALESGSESATTAPAGSQQSLPKNSDVTRTSPNTLVNAEYTSTANSPSTSTVGRPSAVQVTSTGTPLSTVITIDASKRNSGVKPLLKPTKRKYRSEKSKLGVVNIAQGSDQQTKPSSTSKKADTLLYWEGHYYKVILDGATAKKSSEAVTSTKQTVSSNIVEAQSRMQAKSSLTNRAASASQPVVIHVAKDQSTVLANKSLPKRRPRTIAPKSSESECIVIESEDEEDQEANTATNEPSTASRPGTSKQAEPVTIEMAPKKKIYRVTSSTQPKSKTIQYQYKQSGDKWYQSSVSGPQRSKAKGVTSGQNDSGSSKAKNIGTSRNECPPKVNESILRYLTLTVCEDGSDPLMRQLVVRPSDNDTAMVMLYEKLKLLFVSKEEVFQCPYMYEKVCGQPGRRFSYGDLVVHLLRTHKFKFGWDGQQSGSAPSIRHVGSVYACDTCAFRTSSVVVFVEHVRHHMSASVQPYFCATCQASFDALTLLDHLESCISKSSSLGILFNLTPEVATLFLEYSYTCWLCDLALFSRTAYLVHLNQHGACSVQPAKRPLAEVLRTHGVYKCRNCNFRTVLEDAFMEHMRCHLALNPYTCKGCGKEMRNLQRYQSHSSVCQNAELLIDESNQEQIDTIIRQINEKAKVADTLGKIMDHETLMIVTHPIPPAANVTQVKGITHTDGDIRSETRSDIQDNSDTDSADQSNVEKEPDHEDTTNGDDLDLDGARNVNAEAVMDDDDILYDRDTVDETGMHRGEQEVLQMAECVARSVEPDTDSDDDEDEEEEDGGSKNTGEEQAPSAISETRKETEDYLVLEVYSENELEAEERSRNEKNRGQVQEKEMESALNDLDDALIIRKNDEAASKHVQENERNTSVSTVKHPDARRRIQDPSFITVRRGQEKNTSQTSITGEHTSRVQPESNDTGPMQRNMPSIKKPILVSQTFDASPVGRDQEFQRLLTHLLLGEVGQFDEASANQVREHEYDMLVMQHALEEKLSHRLFMSCPVCGVSLHGYCRLIRHFKESHEDGYRQRSAMKYSGPVRILHSNSGYTCTGCAYTTGFEVLFLEHLRLHAFKKEAAWRCECGARLHVDDVTALPRLHFGDEHTQHCKKKTILVQVNETFTKLMLKYRYISNGRAFYSLGEYLATFSAVTGIKASSSPFRLDHVGESANPEKPYGCMACDFITAHVDWLLEHVRSHLSARPYVCTYCNSLLSIDGLTPRGHFNTPGGKLHGCRMDSVRLVHAFDMTCIYLYKRMFCENSTETDVGNELDLALKKELMPDGYYRCDTHDLKTTSYLLYITHLQTTHGDFSLSRQSVKEGDCANCQILPDNSRGMVWYLEHFRAHSVDYPFYCTKCGMELKTLVCMQCQGVERVVIKPFDKLPDIWAGLKNIWVDDSAARSMNFVKDFLGMRCIDTVTISPSASSTGKTNEGSTCSAESSGPANDDSNVDSARKTAVAPMQHLRVLPRQESIMPTIITVPHNMVLGSTESFPAASSVEARSADRSGHSTVPSSAVLTAQVPDTAGTPHRYPVMSTLLTRAPGSNQTAKNADSHQHTGNSAADVGSLSPDGHIQITRVNMQIFQNSCSTSSSSSASVNALETVSFNPANINNQGQAEVQIPPGAKETIYVELVQGTEGVESPQLTASTTTTAGGQSNSTKQRLLSTHGDVHTTVVQKRLEKPEEVIVVENPEWEKEPRDLIVLDEDPEETDETCQANVDASMDESERVKAKQTKRNQSTHVVKDTEVYRVNISESNAVNVSTNPTDQPPCGHEPVQPVVDLTSEDTNIETLDGESLQPKDDIINESANKKTSNNEQGQTNDVQNVRDICNTGQNVSMRSHVRLSPSAALDVDRVSPSSLSSNQALSNGKEPRGVQADQDKCSSAVLPLRELCNFVLNVDNQTNPAKEDNGSDKRSTTTDNGTLESETVKTLQTDDIKKVNVRNVDRRISTASILKELRCDEELADLSNDDTGEADLVIDETRMQQATPDNLGQDRGLNPQQIPATVEGYSNVIHPDMPRSPEPNQDRDALCSTDQDCVIILSQDGDPDDVILTRFEDPIPASVSQQNCIRDMGSEVTVLNHENTRPSVKLAFNYGPNGFVCQSCKESFFTQTEFRSHVYSDIHSRYNNQNIACSHCSAKGYEDKWHCPGVKFVLKQVLMIKAKYDKLVSPKRTVRELLLDNSIMNVQPSKPINLTLSNSSGNQRPSISSQIENEVLTELKRTAAQRSGLLNIDDQLDALNPEVEPDQGPIADLEVEGHKSLQPRNDLDVVNVTHDHSYASAPKADVEDITQWWYDEASGQLMQKDPTAPCIPLPSADTTAPSTSSTVPPATASSRLFQVYMASQFPQVTPDATSPNSTSRPDAKELPTENSGKGKSRKQTQGKKRSPRGKGSGPQQQQQAEATRMIYFDVSPSGFHCHTCSYRCSLFKTFKTHVWRHVHPNNTCYYMGEPEKAARPDKTWNFTCPRYKDFVNIIMCRTKGLTICLGIELCSEIRRTEEDDQDMNIDLTTATSAPGQTTSALGQTTSSLGQTTSALGQTTSEFSVPTLNFPTTFDKRPKSKHSKNVFFLMARGVLSQNVIPHANALKAIGVIRPNPMGSDSHTRRSKSPKKKQQHFRIEPGSVESRVERWVKQNKKHVPDLSYQRMLKADHLQAWFEDLKTGNIEDPIPINPSPRRPKASPSGQKHPPSALTQVTAGGKDQMRRKQTAESTVSGVNIKREAGNDVVPEKETPLIDDNNGYVDILAVQETPGGIPEEPTVHTEDAEPTVTTSKDRARSKPRGRKGCHQEPSVTSLNYREGPPVVTDAMCHHCDFQSWSKAQLESHMTWHEPDVRNDMVDNGKADEKAFACPHCPCLVDSLSDFKFHLHFHKRQSKVKYFHCASCWYKTNKETAIERHHRSKHQTGESIVCEEEDTTYMVKTCKASFHHGRYRCPHDACAVVVDHIIALQEHCVREHGRPLEDKHRLDFSTSSLETGSTHTSVSVSKQGPQRIQPNNENTAPDAVSNETRALAREKSFECDFCAYLANDGDELLEHMFNMHGVARQLFNNLKQNPSQEPNKSANSRADKEGTQSEAHEIDGSHARVVKWYECKFCTHWTREYTSISVHVMIHLNYRPFTCPFCPYRGIRPYHVTTHLFEEHQEVSESYRIEKSPEMEAKLAEGIHVVYENEKDVQEGTATSQQANSGTVRKQASVAKKSTRRPLFKIRQEFHARRSKAKQKRSRRGRFLKEPSVKNKIPERDLPDLNTSIYENVNADNVSVSNNDEHKDGMRTESPNRNINFKFISDTSAEHHRQSVSSDDESDNGGADDYDDADDDIEIVPTPPEPYIPPHVISSGEEAEGEASSKQQRTELSRRKKRLRPRGVVSDNTGSEYRSDLSTCDENIAERTKPATQKTNSASNLQHDSSIDSQARGDVARHFSCPKCGFTTTERRQMRTHIMYHMEYKPYRCPLCAYRTARAGHIQRHLASKTIHPEYSLGDQPIKTVRNAKLERVVEQRLKEAWKPIEPQADMQTGDKHPRESRSKGTRSTQGTPSQRHSSQEKAPSSKSTQQSRSPNRKTVRKSDAQKESADKNPGSGSRAVDYYECRRCPYQNRNMSTMQLHVNQHLNLPLYHCPFCSSKFAYKLKTYAHIERKHKGYNAVSPLIPNPEILAKIQRNIISVYKDHFTLLLGAKADDKQSRKKSPVKESSSKINTSRTSRHSSSSISGRAETPSHNAKSNSGTGDKTSEKLFNCPKCDYGVDTRKSFRRHVMQHLNYFPYKCPICRRTFASKHKAKDHIRGHRSTKAPLIVRNERLEATIKKIIDGDKSKSDKFKKGQHDSRGASKDRSVSKSVPTPTSSRTASPESGHTRSDSRTKLRCDQCSYECDRKSAMQQHIVSHFQYSPFKCARCDYSASYFSCVRRHTRRVHKRTSCEKIYVRNDEIERQMQCKLELIAGAATKHTDTTLRSTPETSDEPPAKKRDLFTSLKQPKIVLSNILQTNATNTHKNSPTRHKPDKPLPVLNLPKLKVVLTDCLKVLQSAKRKGDSQDLLIPDGKDGFVHFSDTGDTESYHTSSCIVDSDSEDVPNKKIKIKIIASPVQHIKPLDKDVASNAGDNTGFKTSGKVLDYHKCTVCGLKSKQKCDLRAHVMRHLNYQIFRCSECTFSAGYRKNIQQHIKSTHTGSKASIRIVRNVKLDKKVEQSIKTVYRRDQSMRVSTKPTSPLKRKLFSFNSPQKGASTSDTVVIGYKCVLCQMEINSRPNMHRHLFREIGYMRYGCPHCDVRHLYPGKIIDHCWAKHQGMHTVPVDLADEGKEKRILQLLRRSTVRAPPPSPGKLLLQRQESVVKVHVPSSRLEPEVVADSQQSCFEDVIFERTWIQIPRADPVTGARQCAFCRHRCTDKAAMMSHVLLHAPPHWRCDSCGAAFLLMKKLMKHASNAHKSSLNYTNLVTGETCVEGQITKPADIPLDIQKHIELAEPAKSRTSGEKQLMSSAKRDMLNSSDGKTQGATQSKHGKRAAQDIVEICDVESKKQRSQSTNKESADPAPRESKTKSRDMENEIVNDGNITIDYDYGDEYGASESNKDLRENRERHQELNQSFDITDEVILINNTLSGGNAPVAIENKKSGSVYPRVVLTNFMEFSIEKLHELLVTNGLHNINY